MREFVIPTMLTSHRRKQPVTQIAVGDAGLEPTTSFMSRKRSTRLSQSPSGPFKEVRIYQKLKNRKELS